MSDNTPPIQLRSEEVQDIMSAVPVWMIRWGSMLVFGILLGLLALSWFIKYPDTVAGEAVVTTEIEPAFLYSKVSGNLSRLYVTEGMLVKKGQLISEINSPVQLAQIAYLQQKRKEIERFLATDNPAFVTFGTDEPAFGEIQPTYNRLKEQFNDLAQLNNHYYQQSMQLLLANLTRHRQLDKIYDEKLAIARRELANNEASFQIDKQLYQEKVIPMMALVDKESQFNQRRMDAQNIREAFVQNKLAMAELQKQVQEKSFATTEAKRKLVQSIVSDKKLLDTFIANWQQNYTVLAPMVGKVVFMEKLSAGYYVKADKPLATVIAQNARIIAKVKVNSARYGKIKSGQKVRFELDNYPFQEYGFIYGVVRTISYIPVDKTYELIVDLPSTLISSYGQRLAYKPNMGGTAEIIVDNQRLLEKLLYFLRRLAK